MSAFFGLQAIKTICQDLFFAHVKKSHPDSLVSDLGGATNWEHSVHVIDELIETRVKDKELSEEVYTLSCMLVIMKFNAAVLLL